MKHHNALIQVEEKLRDNESQSAGVVDLADTGAYSHPTLFIFQRPSVVCMLVGGVD